MHLKVLLAKSPRSYKSHFSENGESLALGYLAAVLRESRFAVDVLDASLSGMSIQETIHKILQGDYGLIGFTIADVTFIKSSTEIINALRKGGSTAHITMGGHTPTFHSEDILSMCDGLDSIVMHEGEVTIVELAKLIKQGINWNAIEGIAYRTISGPIQNPPREFIKNLDAIPFPTRDTVPYILEHKKDYGVVSMSGGRGCPMNCGFCSIRAFYSICGGPYWRIRSNKNVVDEIEYLVNKFGIQEIVMVDDIFVGPGKKNSKRALDFADEIEKRDFGVMLSIAERVDNIDRPLFERLREVGIRNILIGIEAGNQDLLDYFGKGIVVKDIENAVEILKELNIGITASFINFAPETTIDQLRKDLYFYGKLKINVLQGLLNHFQYYRGTPLGEKLRKQHRVLGKFPDFLCPSIDERVNLVYNIAQRSLGIFLAMADKLNKMGRRLRFKEFKAEIDDSESLPALENEMFIYNRFVNSINKDAIKLLSEVINFVPTKGVLNKRRIDDYCNQMAEASLNKYREWNKMLHAFEVLSRTK